MLCEMCGRETPRTTAVRVEGTVLEVCRECERFGEVVAVHRGHAQPGSTKGGATLSQLSVEDRIRIMQQRRSEGKDIYESITEDLVEDYGDRIRKARLGRGMTEEDLGRRINEKKSVIHKLETYGMRPDDQLIRKLERALDLKLKASIEVAIPQGRKGPQGPLTLGDLIAKGKK